RSAPGEDRVEVEQPVLVLRPEGHLGAVGLVQGAGEGHRGAAAAPVHEPPARAGRLGGGDHREDGGDADAAGDEQVVAGGDEREVVARAAGEDHRARVDLVVDPGRAAAAVRLVQDGDAPRGAVGRVAAEGVLADEAGGEDEVEVRARGPGGQAGAGRVAEIEGDDAVGGLVAGVHHQLQIGRASCRERVEISVGGG